MTSANYIQLIQKTIKLQIICNQKVPRLLLRNKNFSKLIECTNGYKELPIAYLRRANISMFVNDHFVESYAHLM